MLYSSVVAIQYLNWSFSLSLCLPCTAKKLFIFLIYWGRGLSLPHCNTWGLDSFGPHFWSLGPMFGLWVPCWVFGPHVWSLGPMSLGTNGVRLTQIPRDSNWNMEAKSFMGTSLKGNSNRTPTKHTSVL